MADCVNMSMITIVSYIYYLPMANRHPCILELELDIASGKKPNTYGTVACISTYCGPIDSH